MVKESIHDISPEEEQDIWERLDSWSELCDHLIEHKNEDFILNFYNTSRSNLNNIRKEYEKGPTDYLFLELAYYTGAFNSLSHKIKEKFGSLPDEDLDDQDDQENEDDEQIIVMELDVNSSKAKYISSKKDEELDLQSLQITQERKDEYSRSCRGLVREWNSNEVFSRLYDEEVKLHKMKCEYKENPTNALLLEAYYQNHVTNTLAIVLQEKR